MATVEARANHITRGCEVVPHLPVDLQNPGYRMDDSKRNFAIIARYVTPQEWQELAAATNESIQRHHACNSPWAMLPMYLTLAVCFCPFFYVAIKTRGRIHADLAQLPATQQLAARGIAIRWAPKTDFDSGGLIFTLPVQMPQMNVEMTGHAQTVPVVQVILVPGSRSAAPVPNSMSR